MADTYYDEERPEFVRVRVDELTNEGVATLIPLEKRDVLGSIIRVKIPVMHIIALSLSKSRLVGKVMEWIAIPGPTCVYNVFFDLTGSNLSLALYKYSIEALLPPPLPLPEVDEFGICRISQLCNANNIYVQTQPEFVDTLTYIIFLKMNSMLPDSIRPAEIIELKSLYIMSRAYENYRVIVEEEVASREEQVASREEEVASREQESSSPLNLVIRNDYSGLEESIDTSSRKYTDPVPSCSYNVMTDQDNGCKGIESENQVGNEENEIMQCDPRNIVTGDEVLVYPIDFGGPLIRVHREYLYDMDAVHERLKTIPEQSLLVKFRSINGCPHNMDVRFQELKIQQKLLKIKTVAGHSPHSPPIFDVFCIPEGGIKYFRF